MKQKETEEFLRNLAGAIDDILQETTGQRLPFTILLWPDEPEKRTNYISNAPREDVIKAMRSVLIRMETGMEHPPDDKTPPLTNN